MTDPSGLAPPSFGPGQPETSSNVLRVDPQSATIATLRKRIVDKVGENKEIGLTPEQLSSTDWDPEALLGLYVLYKGSIAVDRIEAMQREKISIDFNPHKSRLIPMLKNDIFVETQGRYHSFYEPNLEGGGVIHISLHDKSGFLGWLLDDSTYEKKAVVIVGSKFA